MAPEVQKKKKSLLANKLTSKIPLGNSFKSSEFVEIDDDDDKYGKSSSEFRTDREDLVDSTAASLANKSRKVASSGHNSGSELENSEAETTDESGREDNNENEDRRENICTASNPAM